MIFLIFCCSVSKSLKFQTFLAVTREFASLNETSVFELILKSALSAIKAKLRFFSLNKNSKFKFNRPPLGINKFCGGSLQQTKMRSIFFSPLPEYLNNTDRMSMSATIEARVPFLNPNVVRAALSLPLEEHFERGLSKAPIRKMGQGYVSNLILQRNDKMGFVTPQQKWQLTGILKEAMQKELLVILKEEKFSFLNYDQLKKLLESEQWNKRIHIFGGGFSVSINISMSGASILKR